MISTAKFTARSGMAIVCASLLTCSTAWSQSPVTEAKQQAEQKTHIFRLQYLDATSLLSTIRGIMGDQLGSATVAVDAQSNTLLVRGSDESVKVYTELIEALDRAVSDAADKQMKVFSLVHLVPDEGLERILSMIAEEYNIRYAADSVRGLVVANGSASDLAVLEALLLRLDEPSTPGRGAAGLDCRVRVVWLLAGLGEDAGRDPSEDLAAVVGELEKIGVTGLKMVAQSMVSVSHDGIFDMSGYAKVGENCQLSISGRVGGTQTVGSVKARPSLDLQISAHTPMGASVQQLCHLETTVKAPFGHFVILGVTPIEEMASVFVVQLLQPEQE